MEVEKLGCVEGVRKKYFCFYLTVKEDDGTMKDWVVEPTLWEKSPWKDILVGKSVRGYGRAEFPAVILRRQTTNRLRYRLTKPIQIIESFEPPDSVREQQSQVLPSSRDSNRLNKCDVKRSVQEVLEHPLKRIRFAKRNAWPFECFTEQELQEKLSPEIPKEDVSDCILDLLANGEIFSESHEDGLFAVSSYEDLLAPALCLTISEPIRSVDEWVKICAAKYLNRFNVSPLAIRTSAKRLLDQRRVKFSSDGTLKFYPRLPPILLNK